MIELYEASKLGNDEDMMGTKEEAKTLFNIPTDDDIEWFKNLADEVQK